ncbi:MAG: ComF family protein [Ruminococcaceae bacterium]|nr:ComF family protein [Oscillospiraceae bacterium]
MKTMLSERLLSLIFPHKCFLCRSESVPADVWLCDRCLSELPLTSGALCRRCGKAPEDCVCKEDPPGFDGAAVPLFYTDSVARGIGSFKYQGKRYYAHFLAELMAQSVRETYKDMQFSAITYVPLHPAKLHHRGYCQTRLLADELSTLLGIPVESGFLRHTGKGGAQMEQKGPEARKENARLSFAIRKDTKLQGRIFLLVDDVLTTGATAGRCAGLMRQKGAQAVYLAVAATTCYRHRIQ